MTRFDWPFLIILSATLTLTGCGGSSPSISPTAPEPSTAPPAAADFASTLAPSKWQDGDWQFDWITFRYFVKDPQTRAWRERLIHTGGGTLTLSGNGLSGVTQIESVEDGGVPSSMPGGTLDGFTIGDPLTLVGHVDGTTVAIEAIAPNGQELRLIGAPYDGYVTDGTRGTWRSADYFEGLGEISVPGTYGGSGSYVSLPRLVDAPSSEPDAAPVALGKGAVLYKEGAWTGRSSSSIVHFRNGSYTYEVVRCDVALTIDGPSVSGTATLTSIGKFPSFEGYAVGAVFELQGGILGDVIYVELSDPQNPSFRWRQVWGGSRVLGASGTEDPGEVTTLDCRHGVTYRTPNTLGGQNRCVLEWQQP